MADSLLSSNFDIIFIILSLLPTETLLRVQTVCRAWARVISDPDFVLAHCCRPAPITGFFTRYDRLIFTEFCIKPFQECDKFPSSLLGVMSSGFEVVSRSHGVLCFQRDMIFIVGNPVTSSWSIVCYAPPSSSSYKFHGVALIYDPAISLYFKLALALIKLDHSEDGKYCIQFHIYSSKTCSWTISSEYIQWWFPIVGQFYDGIWASAQYEPCKIGGGSVCWIDRFGFFGGNEISTETYWKTPPPLPSDNAGSKSMSSYDNIIYFTRIAYGVAKVWRLKGKDGWVLEGEGISAFVPHSYVYDRARRTLLIGHHSYGELFALHLPSSRLENLFPGEVFATPEELFVTPQVAHGNTLAPLCGAETGLDGLAREFRLMGLSSLDK